MPPVQDPDGWYRLDPIVQRNQQVRTYNGGGSSGTAHTPDNADNDRATYMNQAWSNAISAPLVPQSQRNNGFFVENKQVSFNWTFTLFGPARPFSWDYVAQYSVRVLGMWPDFEYPNPWTAFGTTYDPYGPQWEWENDVWTVTDAVLEYKTQTYIIPHFGFGMNATGRLRLTTDPNLLTTMKVNGTAPPRPSQLSTVVSTMNVSSGADEEVAMSGVAGSRNVFDLLPVHSSNDPQAFMYGMTMAIEQATFTAGEGGTSGNAVGVDANIGYEYNDGSGAGYLVMVYTLQPPRGRWRGTPPPPPPPPTTGYGRLKVDVNKDDRNPSWKFAIPKPGENDGYGVLKVLVDGQWVRPPLGSEKLKIDLNAGSEPPDWTRGQ